MKHTQRHRHTHTKTKTNKEKKNCISDSKAVTQYFLQVDPYPDSFWEIMTTTKPSYLPFYC